MADKNQFILQRILQQFYYSTSSIPITVELTLNTIKNEMKTLSEKWEVTQDMFDEVMSEIITKYEPKNPLNEDERIESRKLIKEEVSRRLLVNVLSETHFEINASQTIDRVEQLLHATESTYNNGVITLITHYEIFLSELLKFHLTNNPKKIKNEYLTPFDKLLMTGNVQALIDDIIIKEVESIMSCNVKEMHEKIFNLGYNDKYFKNNISNIYEIFARRNAIVHNKSIVDSKYMKFGNIYSFKSGDEIKTDIKYLTNAVSILITHVLLLIAHEWNNYPISLDVDDEDNMNNAIERIAFIKLTNQEWINTFYIYDQLRNSNKSLDFQEGFILNYLLSGKYAFPDIVEKEIKRYNYKSRDVLFQLGYLGMQCEYEKIIEIFTNDKTMNISITAHDLLKWPIFKELREKDKEKFAEIIKTADDYVSKKKKQNA